MSTEQSPAPAALSGASVWLVGRVYEDGSSVTWGVFSSEELAHAYAAACGEDKPDVAEWVVDGVSMPLAGTDGDGK